ncbi:hypothetical protein GW17_00040499 [Ensete ventricosum]|nr:hypothetical protein GW17_00040499 [Ensete ventricosum]
MHVSSWVPLPFLPIVDVRGPTYVRTRWQPGTVVARPLCGSRPKLYVDDLECHVLTTPTYSPFSSFLFSFAPFRF